MSKNYITQGSKPAKERDEGTLRLSDHEQYMLSYGCAEQVEEKLRELDEWQNETLRSRDRV
jgi:hypothetical protein